MEIKIAKYLNNARAGFTLVFDDGCYYDSTVKSVEIFKSVKSKTGVKIKATSAQTVGFLHERLIDLWRELIAEGYYDIASHSMDHCLCFNEETPWDVRVNDAKESKRRLEEIYGVPQICYVAPNGGHTKKGCEALHEYYYANRNNNEGGFDPDDMDMYDLGVFIARHEYTTVKPYADFIDTLVENGTYAIQVNHWLSEKEQDTFHAQRVDTFAEECLYIAKLQLENKLWIASMNDAVKYFYERKNAKIKVEGDSISVSCDLDKAIFNHPLTLVITTPSPKRVLINGTAFELLADKENIVTIEI